MTYADKLKLPPWAKFRDFVLDNKDHLCEHCACRTDSPEIVHCLDIPGREPWDYELHEVKLLCKTCYVNSEKTITEIVTGLAALCPEAKDYLCKALLQFAVVDPKGNTNIAHRAYAHVKRACEKFELLGQIPTKHQEACSELALAEEPSVLEIRKKLPGFHGEAQDAWLNCLNLVRQVPEAEQSGVARGLSQFISRPSRGEDESSTAELEEF